VSRRCCCEACIIFEDLFNRSDSSTLGGSWVNIQGTWEISSNECIETTGNGIVRTVRSHPHGAMSSYFTLSLTNIRCALPVGHILNMILLKFIIKWLIDSLSEEA
jgi:hypothetical protein